MEYVISNNDSKYLKYFDRWTYFSRGLDVIFGEERVRGNKYPTHINYKVIDICNSKCLMCHVWKQKENKQLTPEELESGLKEPFFKNVKYMGFSGGEPTLRTDIPELIEAACKALPSLKSVGIITNGIQQKKIFEKIQKINENSKKRKVGFNVMVSIDGIGNVHDQVRGRKGNFETSLKLIENIKTLPEVKLSLGCTIIKENVWYIHDVYNFAKEHSIYTRFRIGEFIEHLYNDDCIEQIRTFSQKEKFHIADFFDMLLTGYEKDPKVRQTYQNIIQMIFFNKSREIGCPYLVNGIHLNHIGQIAPCAPKGHEVANMHDSAESSYNAIKKDRKRLKENHCKTCIHDYHSYSGLLKSKYAEYAKWRIRLSLPVALANSYIPKQPKSKIQNKKGVMITGWYGTETVGDKAILAQVLIDLKSKYPDQPFHLAASKEFVARQTLVELGYDDIEIVSIYSKKYLEKISKVELLVIGGGPLMHIDGLGYLLSGFETAKYNGVKTQVYGCGIGPLNRGKQYENAVKKIISLTDVCTVRDQKSKNWILKKLGRNVEVSGDPAVSYLMQLKNELNPNIESSKRVHFYLRDLPREYFLELSDKEFNKKKELFEDDIAESIDKIVNQNYKVTLYPMHSHHIGGDDRQFANNFISKYGLKIDFSRKPMSVIEIAQSMINSKLNVSMRFHSVVFAHTLKTNFVGIDYSNGGKISSFGNDNNIRERILNINDVSRILNFLPEEDFSNSRPHP